MTTGGLVSIDGRIYPAETAAVSAMDRGLLLGDSIFEVMAAIDSRILDLKAHLERLRTSAAAVLMPVPWSDEALEFELTSLAAAMTAGPKRYLRLVVTRGDGLGLGFEESTLTPRRLVYCFPAKEEPESLYREGIAIKRLIRPLAQRGALPKTSDYLPGIVGLHRAGREGFGDILWSTGDGEITEASSSNIFLIARQGDLAEIVTPPVASGLLPGITRANILALLAKAKIAAREQTIFADEIPRFDEAFLCSSIRGLVPVSAIDRHKLHTARAGSVFRQIERLFNAWVETQVGYAVDWRTGLAR